MNVKDTFLTLRIKQNDSIILRFTKQTNLLVFTCTIIFNQKLTKIIVCQIALSSEKTISALYPLISGH